MACDEAELGADEFAERMRSQEKLQEQVISICPNMKTIMVKMDISKAPEVNLFSAIGDVKAHAQISHG